MQKVQEVTITRFAHDGAGEAKIGSDIIRVFGMLPGETGIVELKRKKGIYVGELKELLVASPERIPPSELHYLASSPWQIVSYPRQSQSKKDILSELYGYYPSVPKIEFVLANKLGGYRTKMEYCVTDREVPLSLAFHERGGGSRRIPALSGSIMASPLMNDVAIAVISSMRDAGYNSRMIKTIVVRESKNEQKCLILVYLKDDHYLPFLHEHIPGLAGLMVFYSTPKSPASVMTKELYRFGEDQLKEEVLGYEVLYSWDSFFQNNIVMFEKALADIIEAVPGAANVVELYSGVGTIGLALAKKSKKVLGVEIIENAVRYAKLNAELNHADNYESICLSSDKIDATLIESNSTLVVDPPRAGMHINLLKIIKQNKPQKLIYLSCNPETQARDYSQLADMYEIKRIVGYDFYPNTPHLESLIVLSLRDR